ncbi:MAG: septal ring lytic transglycosylase RlpA family protein [Cyanobacteria bacterium P01_H01_bin.26]
MNKRFFTGRVAAVALLSAAIPLFEKTTVSAQALETHLETNSQSSPEVSTSDKSLEPSTTDTFQTFLRSSTTVRVNAHEHESRQAATVYVNNIPVLTYVDPADTAEVVSGWLPADETPASASELDGVLADAVTMATQLGAIDGDEAAFTAHWNEGSYTVMAGDSPLVTLSDQVQLPDATASETENVLQVTNRLRRLLGDGTAEPVTEVTGKPAPQQVAAVRSSYRGMASWYGPGFHGRRSASGESFNQYAMTAAHRTLPFGTQVRVTNVNNGRQVVVRINDRGPFSQGRIIDLSAGAASAIGLRSAGVGPVQIEVLR